MVKSGWKKYLLLVGCSFWAVSASAAGLPALEGLLEPNELVEVSSQVPGIIEQLTVERGDLVKKGEVVARLKSGVEEAAVNLAGARVEFAQRKAQRNEKLYKRQLISIDKKDEIETEIQLAQLELAQAEERLKLRTIESTIDGVVVARTGAAGEYVGAESFMTIASINPLNVEVIVPVAFFGMIKKGQVAKILPEEPVGGHYRAKVVIVDHVIDAASGTFGVRLELPNPKSALPAGLKCQVVF
ncbi:MAG: efflux RND transporter periplasmic adaptor subunit [Deltaproteobacteria bacterium]|nr:efflux RND transporter periplasmic adaptor subunit [Deltaproteobacteria bacterium]